MRTMAITLVRDTVRIFNVRATLPELPEECKRGDEPLVGLSGSVGFSMMGRTSYWRSDDV